MLSNLLLIASLKGKQSYADDVLDSGVRDERGQDTWDAEGFNAGRSVHGLMQWFCICPPLDQGDRRRYS